MNYSLFQNIKNAKINSKPFPHVIIENALNDELYEKLSNNFPKQNNFKIKFTENNKRDDIFIENINNQDLDKDIIKFVNYHGSKKFFDEIINYFGDQIIKIHGEFFNDINSLKNIIISKERILKNEKISLEQSKIYNKRKIFLHSAASVNTPVYKKSSVRGPHLDKLDKLFGGLFYLKHPSDISKGGNLEILEWEKHITFENKIKNIESEKIIKQCSPVTKINYKANSFIFFINSINSLHSVTQRDLTDFERRFFYIAGILNHNLYNLNFKKNKKNIFASIIKNIYKH